MSSERVVFSESKEFCESIIGQFGSLTAPSPEDSLYRALARWDEIYEPFALFMHKYLNGVLQSDETAKALFSKRRFGGMDSCCGAFRF
jgi:hypothetical protein